MIIKRIDILNYRAFTNESFDFSENSINYIAGENGVGKSSLFYALEWCLGIDSHQYHYDKLYNVNFKTRSVTKNGDHIPVRVSATYIDDVYGLIEISRKTNVIKNHDKLVLDSDETEIYRIDKNGSKHLYDFRKDEIIDRAQKSILFIQPCDNHGNIEDLVSFIRSRYLMSKRTACNLIDRIMPVANRIFKEICKKKQLDLYFDKKTVSVVFKHDDMLLEGAGSENAMKCLSLLFAIKMFDDELVLIIDHLYWYDQEDRKLLFDFLCKINTQIFMVLRLDDYELICEKDDVRGYAIYENDDRTAAIVI